ncbi:hypothetical protein [Nostoc sp.]|uniref:hypothetical protein n=1 Tax=Nostoc sp. TaxID=1180 RepID=UPI002FF61E58
MDYYKCLDYIKSVTDKGNEREWAYSDQSIGIGSEFKLNFKRSKGVESHARKLPKGSLIILSQVPHECKDDLTGEKKKIPDECKKRYLTHVVELVNDGNYDEQQLKWGEDPWGIFRLVKVHWITDFSNCRKIPVELDVIKVKWSRRNTYAISLESKTLKAHWNDVHELREHLKKELNLCCTKVQ